MPRVGNIHIVFESQIRMLLRRYEIGSRLRYAEELVKAWRRLRTQSGTQGK